MNSNISIPERYKIFRQDLTKTYLAIQEMGYVRSFSEAKTMCKVFNETDPAVKVGQATYVFICDRLQGERK